MSNFAVASTLIHKILYKKKDKPAKVHTIYQLKVLIILIILQKKNFYLLIKTFERIFVKSKDKVSD